MMSTTTTMHMTKHTRLTELIFCAPLLKFVPITGNIQLENATVENY